MKNKPEQLQVKVVGDGAKYAEINGELVPFISNSATARLRHGDEVLVYVEDGYLHLWHSLPVYGFR